MGALAGTASEAIARLIPSYLKITARATPAKFSSIFYDIKLESNSLQKRKGYLPYFPLSFRAPPWKCQYDLTYRIYLLFRS